MESAIKTGLFVDLPKYVKKMTTKELVKFFPPGTTITTIKTGKNKGNQQEIPFYTKAYLMRSIIMNEKKFNHVSYNRTLRGMWYQAVKPTLDKLGLLTEDDQTEEGLTQWDKTLSRYVCNLLRLGKLTFQSLSISDTSRQKSNPMESYFTTSNRVYGYKGSVAPYPNLLIATEKDTVYEIIHDLAKLFGCSCISSKGQNSLGAMEVIIRGMFNDRRNYPDFETIHILTLTDYDPAGYYIADALAMQAKDMLKALGKEHINVEITRIGITPDQLSNELVQANKYTPKKANIEKWMEMTGGIDGEEKGLELDALTPDEIREIFVDEIAEFVDDDVYKEFIKRSYLKQKVLAAMRKKVEIITLKIETEFIDELELDDERFDLREFALDGKTSLPIDELCLDTLDKKITKKVKSFFK